MYMKLKITIRKKIISLEWETLQTNYYVPIMYQYRI